MADSTRQNKEQEIAIAHAFGPMQVLAGPGSGKTYLTIRRIRHLIQTVGIAPHKILVITFTKAAAAEMKERFTTLTQQAYPQVLFGTFHAVYFHILQTSIKKKLTIITQKEKRNTIKHVLMQFRYDGDKHPVFLDELIQEIERAKIQEQDTVTVSVFEGLVQDNFSDICKSYAQLMEEEGRLDFDDILIRCEALLTSNQAVRSFWQNTFSHILVDEFQDISPRQYRIVKLLAAPDNNLFIVGDDDQSIYRFRGASPDLLLHFKDDYPEAVTVTLSANFRCGSAICEAAGLVIAENKKRFPKQIQAVHAEGSGVSIKSFETKEEELSFIAEELKKEADQQGSTAIICRTNAEAAYIAVYLRSRDIPYQIKETLGNPFDHQIARDLIAYLTCAMQLRGCKEDNSVDCESFLRIMNKPARYISRAALAGNQISLSSLRTYYEGNLPILDKVEALFEGFVKLGALRPYTAIDYVRKRLGYDEYLMECHGNKQWEDDKKTADGIQTAAKTIKDIGLWLIFVSQWGEPESNVQNKNGASLMTMHASKGLEYDTVYLPDVNEGTIPGKKARTEEALEEERRMFYVAMTRAKKDLHMLYVTGTKEKPSAPSHFLRPLL